MKLHELLEQSKVNSLYTVVSQGSSKFICYTGYSEENDKWLVASTDGSDIYKTALDSDDIDTYRDISDISSTDTFFMRIRAAFTSGDIQVSACGVKLTLCLGRGDKPITLDLYEAKAAERKQDLSSLVFRLAAASSELEAKLERAERTISELRQRDGVVGGGMNIADIKKGGLTKPIVKQVGMSVVNPASRKRKAATGVQFD